MRSSISRPLRAVLARAVNKPSEGKAWAPYNYTPAICLHLRGPSKLKHKREWKRGKGEAKRSLN